MSTRRSTALLSVCLALALVLIAAVGALVARAVAQGAASHACPPRGSNVGWIVHLHAA